MSKLETLDPLSAYLRERFHEDDEALLQLQKEAEEEEIPAISIGPEQGKFLQILIQLSGTRRILEIGTLGGYSAAWMARALPDDGHIVSLELEEKHAAFARRQWERMNLSEKIEVRVGPALESLPQVESEGPFDLFFIDADKNNYPSYLEWALRMSRPGSVIVGDNIQLGGRLIDEEASGEWVEGMRAFVQRLADDDRLLSTVVPYVDGLAVAVVRE